MIIRVIDFETTGLPSDEGGARIVETAYCDVHVQDGRAAVEGSPVSSLVDPGRPIPPQARAIHHIGDDDVKGQPSQEEALTALIPAPPLDGMIIYSAHNADFERAFFASGAPWICTYKVALRLWPDAPAHGNQVLRYFLDLTVSHANCSPPHRAGPDAFLTAHLLVKCINDGRASVEDMLRWSDGPALYPRVPFGKHKGASWQDVPSDYLQWVAHKSDLDRDIKANARHHLKVRTPA